jgi:hypothetical protein
MASLSLSWAVPESPVHFEIMVEIERGARGRQQARLCPGPRVWAEPLKVRL